MTSVPTSGAVRPTLAPMTGQISKGTMRELKSQLVYGLPSHQASDLSATQRSEAMVRSVPDPLIPFLAPKGEKASATASQLGATVRGGAIGLGAGAAAGALAGGPKGAARGIRRARSAARLARRASSSPQQAARIARTARAVSAGRAKPSVWKDPVRRADTVRGAVGGAVGGAAINVTAAQQSKKTIGRNPEAWRRNDKRVHAMVNKADVSKAKMPKLRMMRRQMATHQGEPYPGREAAIARIRSNVGPEPRKVRRQRVKERSKPRQLVEGSGIPADYPRIKAAAGSAAVAAPTAVVVDRKLVRKGESLADIAKYVERARYNPKTRRYENPGVRELKVGSTVGGYGGGALTLGGAGTLIGSRAALRRAQAANVAAASAEGNARITRNRSNQARTPEAFTRMAAHEQSERARAQALRLAARKHAQRGLKLADATTKLTRAGAATIIGGTGLAAYGLTRSHNQINERRRATGSAILSREAKADLRRKAGVKVRKSIEADVDPSGYAEAMRAMLGLDSDDHIGRPGAAVVAEPYPEDDA